MVPGNSTCPQAWTKEYNGFIMSDPLKKTEFICVDESAEGQGESLTAVFDIGSLEFVTAKWPKCTGSNCGVKDADKKALRCVVCSM